VAVGIRPESLVPTDAPTGTMDTLTLTVYRVEPLGGTIHVYGRTGGGDRVVCRWDAGRAPVEGARWVVHVNCM